MKRLLYLLVLLAVGAQAQKVVLQKNGIATLGADHIVSQVHSALWNMEWGYVAPNGEDKTPVQKTSYSLVAPTEVPGSLDYTVTASEDGGRQLLKFEMTSTIDMMTRGGFACVNFKMDRVAGHEFVAVPLGTRGVIPEKADKASLFRAPAQGIAVKQDDGTYFYVGSMKRNTVLVQDNRLFSVTGIQVRFQISPENINQGSKYMNILSFQNINEEQLQAMITKGQAVLVSQPDQLFWSYDKNGVGQLHRDGISYVSGELAVHGLGWTYNSQRQSAFDALDVSDTERFFQGAIPIPQTKDVPLNVTKRVVDLGDSQTVQAEYRLEIPTETHINGYQLSYNLLLPFYSGATLVAVTPQDGEKAIVIPNELGEKVPLNTDVTVIRVKPAKKDVPAIEWTFDQPTNLYVQDGRGWGGSSIELRMKFFRAEAGGAVGPSVVNRKVTMKVLPGNTPMKVVINDSSCESVTDTKGWFPCNLAWNAPSPIDVSFLNHKPAGKYGFIGVKDGAFVTLGNGQPIRFWGTCSSAGCNFPEKEQAPLIARRIASYGINIYRTHHADANWAERHFFPKNADNTRTFDPESLDRFDYYMYCLKENGIYIYLDQLVNRKFKEGDGVDNAKALPTCGKPYCYFDRKLIELQKEFSRKLWTHVNPYTKLAYKDDPAVAMMEFANENDLYSQPVTLEPYRTRFEEMYRKWAKENNIELPPEKVDFTRTTDTLTRFFIYVTDSYHREMEDFLRNEVGVKVPMTGSNWTRSSALLKSLNRLSYTDSHSYWNHPARDGSFSTRSMLTSLGTIMDGLGYQKMAGKPFFVSEWHAPWPYEFRAELPVWIAAISAFQNWNGLTVYTYRHSSKNTDTIDGAFETFNDPSCFGLFPAAALIYRRGDVSVGQTLKTVALNPHEAETANAPQAWSYPARSSITSLYRTEQVFTEAPSQGMLTQKSEKLYKGEVLISENKQVIHDVATASLIVNTAKSQAVTSFFKKVGKLETDDMTVELDKQFATITLCSLADQPIRQSSKLFMTAVGRSENSDFSYGFMRNKVIRRGKAPIIADQIHAKITVRTDNQALKVYPVASDGRKLPPLESTYANGRLSFTLTAPAIYYVIE